MRETETIIEELENCFVGYDEYILGLLAKLKESRDEEIKKLRDALEEVGNVLYEDVEGFGNLDDARKIIAEALKETSPL